MKNDGNRLLRSLSVAAAAALDSQSVASEGDIRERNPQTVVEKESDKIPQETLRYIILKL